MRAAWKPWRIVVAVLMPVALFFGLVAWAFASPVGAAPDDDYHLTSIWCAQGDRAGLCEPGPKPDERSVPRAMTLSSLCYAHHSEIPGKCAIPDAEGLVPTDRGNFNDHGYPPVYYAVMSVFASPHLGTAVISIRVFNAFLYVGLLTALFLLLPARRRGLLVWSALATLIPLGLFLVASTNPSGWAVLSATTLWLALLGYYEAASRGRTIGLGVVAAISTIIGAGARADAATYGVLAMILVVVLKAERTRAFLLRSLLPVGLAIVSVLLYLSASQGGVITRQHSTLPPYEFAWLLWKNLLDLPWFYASSFGYTGLGWLDTFMPVSVWGSVTLVVSGLAFWGLGRMTARKVVVLAISALAVVFVPLYILMREQIHVGTGVQPRYIYPLLILLVGLCLYGMNRFDLGLSRLQLIVMGALLIGANGIALYTNIHRYTTGTDAQYLNLNSGVVWWWPIPVLPMQMWVLGSFAFAVAVAAAVVLGLSTARRNALRGFRYRALESTVTGE
ncbi:DUF2142 domain-containing protein [Leifsonia sp. 1010]|uniref:DUF2142 domain-containing protein n=1 Tax=Leifsonia sp. 1010 TaxID=2817769 RepID=UPI0028652148|nr:DUF2142 domain-containing protein [Leifsonia sp. 1010]MDR6612450.1 hypothetical protein [Leifsonia sp. 1010]